MGAIVDASTPEGAQLTAEFEDLYMLAACESAGFKPFKDAERWVGPFSSDSRQQASEILTGTRKEENGTETAKAIVEAVRARVKQEARSRT